MSGRKAREATMASQRGVSFVGDEESQAKAGERRAGAASQRLPTREEEGELLSAAAMKNGGGRASAAPPLLAPLPVKDVE